MNIKPSVVDAIGNTPLIRLRRASEETGCEILGKAEFMNPGQSVKDRAALFIVRDAIAKGALRQGGVIVEGTAGNTGIGLALVADAMGFRTVIVIPDNQSQEKKDALRIAGATLVEVPPVPYRDPNNYVRVSGRLAAQLDRSEPNGAIWANQFDNVANRSAHYETTGPEIWEQTGGKVDGFICAVGTGGTLAGTGMALKERNPKIAIGLADPMGAALYLLFHQRRAQGRGHLDHRRHRPGPHHRQPRRRPGRPRLPDQGRRGGRGSSSTFSAKRASASAARRASTSPAPSGSPAISGPGTRSSPCSATTARATSRSCSTRRSCAPTSCPCRNGSRARRRSLCLTRRREPRGLPRGGSPGNWALRFR